MTKCGAFTAKGHPCKGLVRAGSDRCPAHDPARAAARRRSASKAARTKPGGEVRYLKDRLGTLAEDVLAGRVEPKAAAVVTQICGAYARLMEFERKVIEQEQFEARLVALEEGVRKDGEPKDKCPRNAAGMPGSPRGGHSRSGRAGGE